MGYTPPTSQLTAHWKEISNGFNINFEQGQVYTDEHNKEFSGDKLMKLVIDHLVDKKVDLTHDEIIKETLIKGLGEIDYDEANCLLDKFVANGDLVKAKTLYKAVGGKAHIFAPYGSQVKSLKADGHEANTLSRLLSNKKLQDEITTNSLIVVDEDGVIANNEMHKLLKIAQSKNAKVVLLGDTEQTKAISAGKPFDVLIANGMATATIDEIQRQKDKTLKQAVYFATNNEQSKSIKTLEKLVFEIKDRTQRLDTLVTRYVELSADERKKTLIVTGTNNDKDYVNYAIRKELGIAGQGVASTQLKRYDMSKAEMKHARYFKEDTLIELTHNPKNKELKMGELYKVVGKDRHLLIVENSVGKAITFSPTSERLSVYEEKSFEVSKGDRLRVSKGNQEMGTVTGDKLIVENIKNGKIYAKDEKTGQAYTFNINQKNHLDYDYCSTVHSSQGLTVDRVLINIDTKSKTLLCGGQ